MQHISPSYLFAKNILSICALGEALKYAIHSLFIKNIPKIMYTKCLNFSKNTYSSSYN